MRSTLVFVVLVVLAWPVAADEPRTDANLVTAIDVSGSIEMADERLELDGMARALVDPRFLLAIESGVHGRIGFAAFTWANGECEYDTTRASHDMRSRIVQPQAS